MQPSVRLREQADVPFERLIRFFLFFLVLEFLIQLSGAVKEGCETIQHA
jgi:hypothetical protein